MKTHKWLIVSGIVILAALVMLALAAGLTQAQEPGPEGGVQPQGEADVTAPEALLDDGFWYQGRLSDGAGNPLANTNLSVGFRLYTASSGGTPLDTVTVTVDTDDNGLFNEEIDFNNPDLFNGQALYLGLLVAGEASEMTPRQYLRPVPYALSIRPGAVISDARDGVLEVHSTGSGADDDAILAYASHMGEAVEAYSTNGVGVAAFSDTWLAIQAYSYDNTDHPAVFGCSAGDASTCDPYRDDAAAGVFGYGTPGVVGRADWGYGVQGYAGIGGAGVKGEGNLLAYAGWFTNTDQTVLYITSGAEDARDAIYVDCGTDGEPDFRVTNAGEVYADGTLHAGADFAELIEAANDTEYEPGDVLVISTASDRAVELSTHPYSTLVAGVYSADPGFIGSDHPMEERRANELPLAVIGIVPCKVSAENGPIQRGDLLVTSATPGHAMRAGPNPPQGTVLGKALGELTEGSGVIAVLVTLQ